MAGTTTSAGYSAYANTHTAALHGGSLENEALVKSAYLLELARNKPGDAGILAEALRFNVDLWTIFQADLSDPAIPLPEQLKSELLDLSLFMDQSAAKLLWAFNKETLQAMIDVNRTLAAVGTAASH